MKRSQKFPQLLDADWLRDQYETQGKTCPQIASELGCTSHLVAYRANQHGIKLRGVHGGRWEPKLCARCGEEFTPSGPASMFCSKECRLGTRPCEQCGQRFAPTPPKNWQDKSGDWRAYQRRFCSQECFVAYRELHATAERITSEGYVEVNFDVINAEVERAMEILAKYAPEALNLKLLAPEEGMTTLA